jgi:hypothetical protein
MNNGQAGKITFFSIVMIVVLLLAAVIMIMVISEVTKKEKASLTIKINNDKNEPIDGALILVENKQLGYSQGGIGRYIYTSDDIGKRINIKSQLKYYQDADTMLLLEANQMPVTLTMFRPLAALTIVAQDSATSMPISGAAIYIGSDILKSGTTGGDGSFSIPTSRVRLNDDIDIKLEATGYQKAEKFVYITSTDQKETVFLGKKAIAAPVVVRKVESPSALVFTKKSNETAFKPVATQPNTETGPSKTELETELPSGAAPKEDSAFYYYTNGDYNKALEIYRDLTAKTEWSVRADFWLYSADCALHSASDARGVFNTSTLLDALKYADNAERFQNRVVEKWFPAVVQIKKGEANAYLCEANASNANRRTEYRQSALRCLNNGINILRNEKLIDNELFKFALNMRDRVASSY